MWTSGFPYEFHAQPWDEICAYFAEVASRNSDFDYLVDIVESVLASDVADDLAACTSMHDLLVTDRPVSSPPLEVVHVRAPNSLHHAPPVGWVRIEHQSLSGHDDDIEKPASEAVALFWHFMMEKFGVPRRAGL